MEICKNEGDRFQCFFVYAEGRREKNIICHQQKLVLHEQKMLSKPSVYAGLRTLERSFDNKLITVV